MSLMQLQQRDTEPPAAPEGGDGVPVFCYWVWVGAGRSKEEYGDDL